MLDLTGFFKLFPIYGVWIGIGMDVINPGTIGRVTVGANLYQVDFSYKLFFNGLLGLDITFGLTTLVAQLVDNTT